MIWWLLSIPTAAVLVAGVWYTPAVLERQTQRMRTRADVAERFYVAANEVLNDERTPPEILRYLSAISANLQNSRLARQALWSAARGKIRERAERPPRAFLNFLKQINDLPDELRTQVVRAIACGTLSAMLSGGLAGELLMRIALPSTQSAAQQETAATTIGPEMFGLAT